MKRMKHPRVDHFTVAAACRANPGQWQDVGEYNSTQSADGAIDYILKATIKTPAQRSAYSPAGAFQARRALTEFGAMVQARFVEPCDDAAWLDAVAALPGGAA